MTKPKMRPNGRPESSTRSEKIGTTAIRSVSDWLIYQVLGDSSIEVLFGGLCQRFADAELDYPVLEEFKDLGATNYLALITAFGEEADAVRRRNGMFSSWTTDRGGSFDDS